MGRNIDNLGKEVNNRMQEVFRESFPFTLNLGKINSSGGLKIDNFGDVIPKGSYMINFYFTLEPQILSTKGADGHSHIVEIPSHHERLRSGDRVLVAWVGKEPIVVAKVVSS